VIGKEPGVFASLAERRQMNAEHGDAIVQVFAEPADGDLTLDVAVGCGNETDVGLERRRAAHPLVLPFLQDAKQLRLHRRRELADLVQEERAAGRELKATALEPSAPVKAPRSCPTYRMMWTSRTPAGIVARSLQSRVEAGEQRVGGERLRQVAEDPGPDRSRTNRVIRIRGDEDGRNRLTSGHELVIELDAGGLRHSHVGDEARDPGKALRLQQSLRGREHERRVACGIEQVLQRFAYQRVVVDDRDHLPLRDPIYPLVPMIRRYSARAVDGRRALVAKTDRNRTLRDTFVAPRAPLVSRKDRLGLWQSRRSGGGDAEPVGHPHELGQ
jgi:hypothetical protein